MIPILEGMNGSFVLSCLEMGGGRQLGGLSIPDYCVKGSTFSLYYITDPPDLDTGARKFSNRSR